MRFELRSTSDGSFTVFDNESGECFKSRHAAKLESEHVFYRPGVQENPWRGKTQPLRILEFGFGLGTNLLHLATKQEALQFISIDRDLAGARFFLKHAPDPLLAQLLEDKSLTKGALTAQLMEADFATAVEMFPADSFHCIFFDPFSPKANPDAWTAKLFALCTHLLAPAGRLVTYSVSRQAKDAAEAAGLLIQKHKLPPELNKRSALLAIKHGKVVN